MPFRISYQFFRKKSKSWHLGQKVPKKHIFDTFSSILNDPDFSRVIRPCTVTQFTILYHHAKNLWNLWAGSMIFFSWRTTTFWGCNSTKVENCSEPKGSCLNFSQPNVRLLNRILVHLLVNIGQLCNLLLPSCHPYHFFIQVTLLLTSYHIMQLH